VDIGLCGEHLTEVYYNGTFAVDYLRSYAGDVFVGRFKNEKYCDSHSGTLHLYAISKTGTLIKWECCCYKGSRALSKPIS